jgi:bloom syndrome protein
MEDQVASFDSKGIRAIHVLQEDYAVEKLHAGQYQILFFSPEGILPNETWRDMIQSLIYRENVVVLVVDEAHCVKK